MILTVRAQATGATVRACATAIVGHDTGMRIIEPGHVYALRNTPDGTSPGEQAGEQVVRFVRRRDGRGEKIEEVAEGTLSQELLRVLIDRTLYLFAEKPCAEDVAILEHLRAALTLYETRAAGQHVAKLVAVERASVCPTCQHIVCAHERTAATDLSQGS